MAAFLMNCPFCDDPLIEFETMEDGEGHVLSVQAVCDECGAKGPEASMEARAAEVWNRPVRTPDAASEIERLRATLLNIQALAERGWPINNDKLSAQCRHALTAK